MEGSYGNVFPANRAMSPSVSTPSSNERYKVNVSRQKTKKWANFKPQNYDGDDWGADYDEPDDEPEPLPPPKPMGPRHPGAHSPNARHFNPADPTPLPSQVQQWPGGPERRATAPNDSPLPSMLDTAVRAEPNKPAYSPPALSLFPKQTSPASKSPRAPFPPRKKSNMGSTDAADAIDARRPSGSNPQTNENPAPRLEARATFPLNAGPVTSSTKSPPFAHPADVYRPLEHERGNEHRPSGSGSLMPDSALGRGGAMQGGSQNRQAGVIAEEYGDTARGLLPGSGLASVAERGGEHGIEGLPASHESEALNAAPATTQTQMNSAPAAEHNDLRRFSTSPKLPDLSRMSGFGDDLFSSSGLFPNAKGQSGLAGNTRPWVSNQGAAGSGEPVVAGGARDQSPALPAPQSAVSNLGPDADAESAVPRHASSTRAKADAAPIPPNEIGPAIGQPLREDVSSAAVVASEQQPPAADASHEVTSCETQEPAPIAVRPSIPGGWVTETATTPSDLPASSLAGPSQDALDEATKSLVVISGTENNAEPEVVSLASDKPQQSEPEKTDDTMEAGLTQEEISLPAHPASPRALPPLQTSSPTLSTSFNTPSQQIAASAQIRDMSPSGAHSAESSSPIPADATPHHAEITPTAPLKNARRELQNVEASAIMSPDLSHRPFGTRPTLDTSNNSPMKDSDVLSDEIFKSLSPMQSFDGAAEGARGSTAAYHAAANSMRESSYLGDVYGDYWAATDDRPEPVSLAVGKTGQPEKPENPSSPPGAPTQAAAASPSPSPPPANASEARTGSADGGTHRRNFSWEAGSAGPAPASAPPSTAELPVEQKAAGSGLENFGISVAELAAPVPQPLQLSPNSKKRQSAMELNADSAPEVNQAAGGTLLPKLLADRDTPSPMSVLSERQGGTNRLSLAEEKIFFQDSTSLVAPSPPLELHPALVDDHQLPEVVVPASPLRRKTTVETVNVFPFRSIMEQPSPAERIKHYNQARLQVSEIDTGLAEWMEAMMARHPEHAQAGFALPVAAPNTQQGPQGLAMPMPLGNTIHLPPLPSLGALGHSSNQVGTKGKELLMAAGKAGKGFGKGLLSKGRNKLRGTTGDK